MSKTLLERVRSSIFKIIGIEHGVINFSTGDHEIFVKTRHKRHKRVWFCISGHQHHPTCGHLSDDMFTVGNSFDHGFVVKAHIESNNRTLYWALV